MSESTEPLKKTPLNEVEKALGGRMVDFGGWELPVQFSGILEEHEAVRTNVGVFDVAIGGRNYWTPQLERMFGLEPGTFGGTVAEILSELPSFADRPGRPDRRWRVSRGSGTSAGKPSPCWIGACCQRDRISPSFGCQSSAGH